MEEINSIYAKALLDKIKEVEIGLKYYIDRVNSLENENKVLSQMYENRVEQSLQQMKYIVGDESDVKD